MDNSFGAVDRLLQMYPRPLLRDWILDYLTVLWIKTEMSAATPFLQNGIKNILICQGKSGLFPFSTCNSQGTGSELVLLVVSSWIN